MIDLTAVAVSLVLCPPVPDDFDEAELLEARARLREHLAAQPPPAPPAPPEGGVAGLGDVGQWDAVVDWPVVAIHAALLPDGRVLHYSYPAKSQFSRAMVWDPLTSLFEDIGMSTDIFCSGHTFLADGNVLVTGGNDYTCDFQGRVNTFIYDVASATWLPQDNMADGRWYPTNVLLPDGRSIITSGLALDCDTNAEMELFTPGEGVTLVPEGHRYLALYPRLHLLSDGRIAHVGPEPQTWTFTLGAGWTYHTNTIHGQWRGQGTSVLLPGAVDEIMIIGGESGGIPTATCEIIDFKAPTPTWRGTGALNFARAHADALILPDRSILVVGGGTDGLYGSPVMVPELFDPVSEKWTALPPHQLGRMYHATTLLLPDGRVLVAGQDSGPSAYSCEMYNPPYLFRGPRPAIDDAPPCIVYGQPFDIESQEAASITSAALIRLSSVTHSVNFEQRYVPVEFTLDGATTMGAIAPDSPALAPPGYYMLFILDDGVPSVAEIIRLGPPHPADINADGRVDVDDLVAVIVAWGPCPVAPTCPGDVNDDSTVNVDDLVQVILNWGDCL